MKLRSDDLTGIQAALDAVQGAAYAGTFKASEVEILARDCEMRLHRLGLLMAERSGNAFAIQARTGGKRYSSATTIVTLTRGSTAWFVTDIVRRNVWDRASLVEFTLGDRTPPAAVLGERLIAKVGA